MISQLLKDLLASLQGDAPVRRVVVGAFMTAVCSRRCGIAATIISDAPYAQAPVKDAGELESKSARELAQYAQSENPLEASIFRRKAIGGAVAGWSDYSRVVTAAAGGSRR